MVQINEEELQTPPPVQRCETWTLTLREEQRLRVFENKVLRKIFRIKRAVLTGEWIKLYDVELYALYSSPDIIRNMKTRSLRWAGHVARMSESRNAYRVLFERPERKRPLGRPRRRWKDNIKMDLRKVGYVGRDWINPAQDRDRCRTYVRVAMNLKIVVITEDVQNVHLLLEYRSDIDVSLTCEHDPKLQEYCICPQNMPQFDSEGIPNQAPETNKPMILNGPTSRNQIRQINYLNSGHYLWSVQVQEIQPKCIAELINSFLVAFCGGSSRATATRLTLDAPESRSSPIEGGAHEKASDAAKRAAAAWVWRGQTLRPWQRAMQSRGCFVVRGEGGDETSRTESSRKKQREQKSVEAEISSIVVSQNYGLLIKEET
ncbi:hypothetical protein ANN_08738 [Periplaneta americana]|uniref:Uncharacterized protein n=1 Tax=Periplaneta americana TaxID=6978 RepID=A0ABQ8T2A4_PERAM|nr:hypothetical protein ANN_08738 [Periplaneta americana]